MNRNQLKSTFFAISIFAATFFTACNNNSKPSNSTAATVTEEPVKGCYLAVIKQDTIQLALTAVNESAVEGSLVFNFAEKDDSEGTFQGTYTNGVLFGDYTFRAEGTTSVRQVIFKKVPEGFVEGFGEVKVEGGKELFKDTSAVLFDNDLLLRRTEACLP